MTCFKSAYATKQGTAHEELDIPCQDYIAVQKSDDGKTFVMVLCDGAGSYELSHITAKVVSENLAKKFVKDFDALVVKTEYEIKEYIIQESISICQKNDVEAKCTLLLCAVNKERKRILAHIGDGYMIGRNDSSTYLLMDAENGDEPNQTYFLSGNHTIDHLFVKKDVQQADEMILMCSDGVGVSLVNHEDGKIASAVVKIHDWMKAYEAEVVRKALENGLTESFRLHSKDDLSIGVMTMNEIENKDIYTLEVEYIGERIRYDIYMEKEYRILNLREETAYQDFLLWVNQRVTEIEEIMVDAAEAYHLGFAGGYFKNVEEALEFWPKMKDSIDGGARYTISVKADIDGKFHYYQYWLNTLFTDETLVSESENIADLVDKKV